MEKRGVLIVALLFVVLSLYCISAALSDDDLFGSEEPAPEEIPPNEPIAQEPLPEETLPDEPDFVSPLEEQAIAPIQPLENVEEETFPVVDIQKEAGITPASSFWGFDVAFDRMAMSLLINPSRLELRHQERVAKGLKIAEERLWEIQLMAEQNDVSSLAKASKEYQNLIHKMENDLNSLDGYGQEQAALAVLRLNQGIKAHEQLLKQTQETINRNIKGGLTEKEQALFGSAIAGMQSSGQGFQSTFQQKKDQLVIVVEESPVVDDVQAYVPKVPLQPATNLETDADQAKVKLAEAYSQRDLVFQKAQDVGFSIPVETQQKIDSLLQEAQIAYDTQQYGNVRELVGKATVLLEMLDGDISSVLQ